MKKVNLTARHISAEPPPPPVPSTIIQVPTVILAHCNSARRTDMRERLHSKTRK